MLDYNCTSFKKALCAVIIVEVITVPRNRFHVLPFSDTKDLGGFTVNLYVGLQPDLFQAYN